MWLLLVTFAAGMMYGSRAPESPRRTRILALDLLVALGLALIAGAFALLLDAHPLGLEERTVMNQALSLLFVGLAFVVGAWVADLALTQRAARLAPERDGRHARGALHAHPRLSREPRAPKERGAQAPSHATLRPRHPHRPRGSA